MLILLSKNVSSKISKTLKKQWKKTSIFFLKHFYVDWYNFYNKNCLFDANFFEFEVKSYSPFFLVASSLRTLWLLLHWQSLVHTNLVETQPIKMIMLLRIYLNSLCDFVLLWERAIYQSSLHLLTFIGGSDINCSIHF